MSFEEIIFMKNYTFTKAVLAFLLCSSILTSCSDDDKSEPMDQQNQTTNPALPSTVASQVVNMIFTSAQTGAPYTLNQEVKVTFSSSGMLFLDENPSANDGDEVNVATFTKKGVEYVWDDASNDYSYALSLKTDSSINELNVSKTSTSAFLGSFKAKENVDATVMKTFTGTYNVTRVSSGTHSRMTVIVKADGGIDFDSNLDINVSDYARITDNLATTTNLSIDTKPYPVQPYGRIVMYTDSTKTRLVSMDYRPDHPAVTNRIELSF